MPLEYRMELGDAETAVPELVVNGVEELVNIPVEYRLESGNEETPVPVTGPTVAAPLELV